MPPCEQAPDLRPPFLTAPRGPFARDYFYEVHFGEDVAELSEEPLEGAIVSAGPDLSGQFVDWVAGTESQSSVQESVRRCPVDPGHITGRRTLSTSIIFVHSGVLPPIFAKYAGLAVRGTLRARLDASDLRGLSWTRLIVEDWGSNMGDEVQEELERALNGGGDLWQLDDEPPYPGFRGSIQPPDADRCPYCGHAPLTCPGCGRWESPCPDCGRRPIVSGSKATPEELAAGVILMARRSYPGVMDPRRWDGSDYCGGGFMTRRMVDHLLSLHVWPFVAVPVPTLVEGLTDEERAKLETARDPVIERPPVVGGGEGR